MGLGVDHGWVKQTNGGGFVNRLTTHLINAIGHKPVTHIRARIVMHEGKEPCRVDGAPSGMVWATTSKNPSVCFVRANNLSRAWSDDEVVSHLVQRTAD